MKNLQTSLFLRGILVLIVMILLSSCAPSVTEIVIPTATSDNLSIAQADWATRVAYVEPTFDASKCIGWGKLDDSYLGEIVCVRGVIERIEHNATNPAIFPTLYFSGKPNTFYTFGPNYFHLGDCILVTGVVAADENGTLYMSLDKIMECP